VTQSNNDDWPFDFGDFSLMPDIGASALFLKHHTSGLIWHFTQQDDGTLGAGTTIIGDRSVNVPSTESARHACNEILKRAREGRFDLAAKNRR
jgi:hypothetical protein